MSADQMPTGLGSALWISATAAEGVEPAKLEAAILDELTSIASTPPTAAEMERLKNNAETNFLAELEREIDALDANRASAARRRKKGNA